jgi:hypothetical protein
MIENLVRAQLNSIGGDSAKEALETLRANCSKDTVTGKVGDAIDALGDMLAAAL